MLLTANAISISGEASDASEAEILASTLQPNLVVLDSSPPDVGDLKTVRRIAEAAPSARIIFLSHRHDEAFVEQALVSGASCYLLKATAAADLCWAIKAAQKGREYFSPTLIQRLRDPAATVPEPDQLQELAGPALSPIEARLMAMINQGLLIRQLAQQLCNNINLIGQHCPALPPKPKPRRRYWLPGWNSLQRTLAARRSLHPANSGAV
jgi:DNA-binding NarL/FixJ family response regulator